MEALWKISAADVKHLQGSTKFNDLVNDLIRDQAAACHLATNLLQLNPRQEVADGGVDGAVDAPMHGDTTGWFGAPTGWQFKSRPYKSAAKPPAGKAGGIEAGLRFEIGKAHMAELIGRAYGCRLCICDDMPDATKKRWLAILADAAAKISAAAPRPMILTAHDVAAWANRFPSICIKYFKPHLRFDSFEVWGAQSTRVVRDFVPVPKWDNTMRDLTAFCDLRTATSSPVAAFQGEAGVGKTRLVYESVKRAHDATSLMLYTNDQEEALQLAKQLARASDSAGILVADECRPGTRVAIERELAAHTQRARAICIDNSGQRPLSPEAEVVVEQPPAEVVEKILEANFATIPRERRRGFVALSGGFIRLAVDLCQQNHLLPDDGDPSKLLDHFQRHYLAARLDEQGKNLVEALALFTTIGYRDEVASQLTSLSSLMSVDAARAIEIAKRIKDAPGFIAFGGRFLYITPEIIARTAFASAWRRYVADDPATFLRNLSPDLLEPFHERVERSGTKEIKEVVAHFFVEWADRLTADDLGRTEAVRRLVQLIEMEPATYLPILRRLVEQTPIERLRELQSRSTFGGGPRRPLVWFAEKAAIFPELFPDIEAITFRLALAESEPNLGNNATQTWISFFRIFLSGTSIPFEERFELLRRRLGSIDPAHLKLAIAALEQPLNTVGVTRLAIPPIVMGRIPPEQWRPATHSELNRCRDLIASYLVEASSSSNRALADAARQLALSRVRTLLQLRYLRELECIFSPKSFPDELRPQLFSALDDFFSYGASDEARVSSDGVLKSYVESVREWYRSLLPRDLSGRLVTAVGVDPWHHQMLGTEKAWREQMDSIAAEMVREISLLRKHLGWLGSDKAASAFAFGESLGSLDQGAALFDLLSQNAVDTKRTDLLRGYVSALLKHHPAQADRISAFLDKAEALEPTVVYDLATVGGEAIKGPERIFRIVNAGALPAQYLMGIDYAASGRDLTVEELRRILDSLTSAVASGNDQAADVGLRMLYARVKGLRRVSDPNWLGADRLLPKVEAFLKAVCERRISREDIWDDVMEAVMPHDPEFAIALVFRVLVSNNVAERSEAERLLVTASPNYGRLVLSNIRKVLNDKENGWKFTMFDHRDLMRALPLELLSEWLDTEGLPAARGIARSLPGPFVDNDRGPTMPPVTEFVLSRFGDDERVFDSFRTGLHSGQLYGGNIAAQHEAEAQLAESFLNHPVPAIRRWAAYEIKSARADAQRERQLREEELLA